MQFIDLNIFQIRIFLACISSLCAMCSEIVIWYEVHKKPLGKMDKIKYSLLCGVGWDYFILWGEIMMWVRLFWWCGVRIVIMWGDIIGWCRVRLLNDVVWDYWMMWGEIIACCGVILLHDVGCNYCMMWGAIIGWCGVRLLEDVGWD